MQVELDIDELRAIIEIMEDAMSKIPNGLFIAGDDALNKLKIAAEANRNAN